MSDNCWDCGEPLTRDEVVAGGNCAACYEAAEQRVAIKATKDRLDRLKGEGESSKPVFRSAEEIARYNQTGRDL